MQHMRQEADAAILNSAPPLRDEGKFHGESSRADDGEQRGTIFESCLASDDLSEEEKCADRLAQEAFAVIVAGGEASARTLSTASFHIAANKDVLSRLRLELEEAFPDPNKELNLNTLEKLPWLVRYPDWN
jgi:cytochrome P450